MPKKDKIREDLRFWSVKIISFCLAILLIYGAIKLNIWMDNHWFNR
jgi:hypothetical protein